MYMDNTETKKPLISHNEDENMETTIPYAPLLVNNVTEEDIFKSFLPKNENDAKIEVNEYAVIESEFNSENVKVNEQLDRLETIVSDEKCLTYLKDKKQSDLLRKIEIGLRQLWSILKNDNDKERNTKIYNILYKTSKYEQSKTIFNINRLQYNNSAGIYGPYSMLLYPLLIIPSEASNVLMKLYRQRKQDDNGILSVLVGNVDTLEKACRSKGGMKKKLTLKRKKYRKDRHQKTKNRRSSKVSL